MSGTRADWSTQMWADLLDQRLEAVEKHLTSRVDGIQTAAIAATAALDKRLDGMNEFRAAVQDLIARCITRLEFEAEIKAVRESMDRTLGPINDRLAAQGKPNWFLLIALASVFLTLCGGCWLMIGLQINLSNTPQIIAIQQLRAENDALHATVAQFDTRLRQLDQSGAVSSSADTESRLDRSRLNSAVTRLQQDFSSGSSERKAGEERFTAEIGRAHV